MRRKEGVDCVGEDWRRGNILRMGFRKRRGRRGMDEGGKVGEEESGGGKLLKDGQSGVWMKERGVSERRGSKDVVWSKI